MRLVCLILFLQLVSGEYVWENSEWVWKGDSDSSVIDGNSDDSYDEGSGEYDDDYDYEGSGDDGYDWDNQDNYGGQMVDQYGGGGQVVNNYDAPPVNNWNHNANIDLSKNDDISLNEDKPAPTTPTTTTTTTTTTTPKKGLVENSNLHPTSFFAQPGILAAVIGGAVVGLLCAILLVMFIVYRMRKKDEGSYALDEPRRSPNTHLYSKAPTREFFA